MRHLTVLLFLAALFGHGPLFAKVIVVGVSDDIAAAVRDGVSIGDDCDRPEWLVRYRVDTAAPDVRRTLETFGYYNPQIVTAVEFPDKCFVATIHVTPGPPALIDNSRILLADNGASQVELARLFPPASLGSGQRFDHVVYEAFKTRVENQATRLGFAESMWESRRVEVDAAANTANIDLAFRAGPRYAFGDVHFETDRLESSVLARLVPFTTGEPYDSERLGDLYDELLGTGYFNSIGVRLLTPDSTKKEIPVQVDLQVGNSRQSRVGVGVSTDLGPEVFVGQQNRLVNSRGHQIDADISVSAVRSEIGGYYRVPQGDRANGWLSLYGGYLLEDTETSRGVNSTVGVRQILPRKAGWVQTRFVEINHDRFDVAGETQSKLYVMPGVNVAWTRTDNNIARPQRAHHVALEVSGTTTELGSSIDFLSVSATGKLIRPLAPSSRVLARLRAGYLTTGEFSELPPRLRFYAGGDASVRGFDYESIGVVDGAGNVLGGDRLLEASLEVDYAFNDRWAVALFSDAGSVGLADFSSKLEQSVGLGVRWYSPIGPVRFDVAHPLDSDSGFRIHISLGPEI